MLKIFQTSTITDLDRELVSKFASNFPYIFMRVFKCIYENGNVCVLAGN